MSKIRYDVCVGQKGKDEKTYWKKIGVILQGDKGFSMKIEMIPTVWDGCASLFEPREKEAPKPKEEDGPAW